jgi:tRNA pseudouridine55 synthase
MTDGLVVVDKPAGMTSHDVVGRCRRIFGQRRVGHAGTLDPDATGVLLVGLGQATRLLQFLTGMAKGYQGQVVLGAATATLDESGELTGRWDMAAVTLEQARATAATLTGPIDQIPPMVSAVKIGGRRLHQLAREGVEVERPARHVTVHRFDVRAPDAGAEADGGPFAAGPVFDIEVECSSGTYVRSLAADLGERLGGGGYLRRLRRTFVGPWPIIAAVPLDELGPDHVITPAAALRGMDSTVAPGDLSVAVGHGAVLERHSLAANGDGPWAVLDADGRLLAVYGAHTDGRVKPIVVMAVPG